MGSVKKMALAGTAALLSTTAFAADLSLPPPAAPLVRPVPVVVDSGGWYLRGDVGIGMQNFKSFDFTQTNAASGAVWPASWRIDQKDIGDSALRRVRRRLCLEQLVPVRRDRRISRQGEVQGDR